MIRKIKIIAFAIAFAGILAETFAFMTFIPQESVKIFFYIKSLLSTLGTAFFNFDFFSYHNFDNGLQASFVNLFFYTLLLTGALVYHFSKQKETRLIRFFFAITLISHGFYTITSVITPFVYWQYLKGQNLWWLNWAIGRVVNIGMIYLSLYILRNTKKDLDITYDELNGHQLPKYNFASGWQRLFHLVVDLYLCIFIFSGAIHLLGQSFLGKLESTLGERGLIYVFIFIFRLVYYPVFEAILGATPAKFLTETRVTDEDGKKVTTGNIILRTFARFIPFEAFSFLGAGGWHDTLTHTQVVREVRTGVKGRWYFIILPTFLLIGLGIYFAHEEYKDYKSHQYWKKNHETKIKLLETALDNISTNDLIKIVDVDNSYSSKAIFLKVEEVDKDEIVVAILEKEKDYPQSMFQLEKLYNQNKNYLSTIPIKRSELKKAYTPDYDKYERDTKSSANLLMDGRKFEIEKIEKFFCPVIRDGSSEYYSDSTIQMKFYNIGWPAQLIEIKNLKGEVKWENELPEYIPTIESGEYPNFYLKGSNYKYNSEIKFKIVLKDSLGQKHNFIIERNKDSKTVYPE